jgi:hypothetical protein
MLPLLFPNLVNFNVLVNQCYIGVCSLFIVVLLISVHFIVDMPILTC